MVSPHTQGCLRVYLTQKPQLLCNKPPAWGSLLLTSSNCSHSGWKMLQGLCLPLRAKLPHACSSLALAFLYSKRSCSPFLLYGCSSFVARSLSPLRKCPFVKWGKCVCAHLYVHTHSCTHIHESTNMYTHVHRDIDIITCTKPHICTFLHMYI